MSGLLPVVGGAVVASALAGCATGDEPEAAPELDGSPARRMAYQPVSLRPGMRYLNVMPRAVPAARLRAYQG